MGYVAQANGMKKFEFNANVLRPELHQRLWYGDSAESDVWLLARRETINRK
jgi:hypothetical protein